MTEFAEFSEHARLYAQHEAIVDELCKRMKADVEAFWTAVCANLSASVSPAVVEPDKLTAAAPFSYLRARSGERELASIWVTRNDGRLVREGVVHLGFGLPCAATDAGALDEGVKAQALLKGAKRVIGKSKPTPTSLFEAEVLANGDDPVDAFARVVEPVMVRLMEIAQQAASGKG